MTVVDFLRHGETGAGDALLGRTDLPLSAAGREGIARWVPSGPWSAIISSPLQRAKETAEIVVEGRGQGIEFDPDWREIDFGHWDGCSRRDLARDVRFGAFYENADANPPPGGEAMSEVRTRIAAALERLAARSPGPVLVVAHGGAIRAALSILLAIPLERLWAIRIGCATRIRVEMGSDPAHGLWGEIVEIVQPVESERP